MWFMNNGELISEEDWKEAINSLRAPELEDSKEEIISQLTPILEKAIEKYCSDDMAVLFSGGVDSTYLAFVAKKLGFNPVLVTVGFYDENQKYPEDVEVAKKAAKELGLKHEIVLLNFEEAEKVLKETASILGKELATVVNVGVGSVEVAGFKKIKELGITNVIGGLGSEEIYAGYERHEKADNVQEECWNGLLGMYERDLLRDVKLAKHFGLNAFAPLLDKEVIKFSMQIPDKFKLSKENKKIILRKVAEESGLQKEFSRRKKSAAQYGSRTDKALGKLAKRAKLQKKELIESWF